MKLARVFCFLIIFGSSAIAAHAQTPIDSGSINDPRPSTKTPDGCSPPYCVNFTYTGPTLFPIVTLPVFFSASPFPTTFDPLTTSYTCGASGTSAQAAAAAGLPSYIGSNVPITCLMSIVDISPTDADFLGMWLFVPGAFNGETFDMSVMGGTIGFVLPAGTSCVPASECTTVDGVTSFSIDPVPEPHSSVLFMTGLLLFSLGSFARKRFGASSPV